MTGHPKTLKCLTGGFLFFAVFYGVVGKPYLSFKSLTGNISWMYCAYFIA